MSVRSTDDRRISTGHAGELTCLSTTSDQYKQDTEYNQQENRHNHRNDNTNGQCLLITVVRS